MAKIQLSLQLAELASSQQQPDLSGIPRCLHNINPCRTTVHTFHNFIITGKTPQFDATHARSELGIDFIVKPDFDGIADCSKELTLMCWTT